jgi:hypothetical protein
MKHLKRIFEKVEDDKVEIMNLLSEIVDEFDGLEMEDVSYNYVDEDDIAIQISGFNNLLGEFERQTNLDYLIFYKKLINLIVDTAVRIEEVTGYSVEISGLNSIFDYDQDYILIGIY